MAGLGDDGESEKQLPWATEEDGDAEGLRIDLALDPRHTHNLIQMKKKEHEGLALPFCAFMYETNRVVVC